MDDVVIMIHVDADISLTLSNSELIQSREGERGSHNENGERNTSQEVFQHCGGASLCATTILAVVLIAGFPPLLAVCTRRRFSFISAS